MVGLCSWAGQSLETNSLSRVLLSFYKPDHWGSVNQTGRRTGGLITQNVELLLFSENCLHLSHYQMPPQETPAIFSISGSGTSLVKVSLPRVKLPRVKPLPGFRGGGDLLIYTFGQCLCFQPHASPLPSEAPASWVLWCDWARFSFESLCNEYWGVPPICILILLRPSYWCWKYWLLKAYSWVPSQKLALDEGPCLTQGCLPFRGSHIQ